MIIAIHNLLSSPLTSEQSYANLKPFLDHLIVSNLSKKMSIPGRDI